MTHPAVEAVARAIGHATDFDGNPLDGHFHIKELREFATAAIRALLDVPVSEGMIRASASQFLAADIFTAMLTQLVKEIEREE